MSAAVAVDEIPGPRGLPLVGNIFDVDRHNPVTGFMELARQYGPIFKLGVPGGVRLMVSGADLVDELCDDARFDKKVGGGLASVRQTAVGRGWTPSPSAGSATGSTRSAGRPPTRSSSR